MKCKLQDVEDDNYKQCRRLETDLNQCYETLYMFYYSSRRDDVLKNMK